MRALADRLKNMKAVIENDFPQWANVVLGNTATTMIKNRVIKTGVAADGSKFKPYSTKPILVGAKSFRTKAAAESVFGSRAKRKASQWRTIQRGGNNYRLILLPGGYKRIREIEGSQVAHKSFLRSGEMWLSVRTLGTRKEGEGKYVTTVGSETPLSIKKLEGNSEREGKDLLMLSTKEEQDLTLVLDKYITNIVNRALNG